MAKFRFTARKRPSVGYVITGVTSLALYLLVGNNILNSVATTIGNFTNVITYAADNVTITASPSPFYTAMTFLGLTGTNNGTWAANSIVGILGLAAVASFVLAFVKVSFK